MKKRKSKKRIGIIKYFGSMIGLALFLGFFEPLLYGNGIKAYESPWHWIVCLISAFLVYNIVFYFDKINPRKMYNCIGMLTAFVICPICTIAFLAAFVYAGILKSVILMIVIPALYLFLIYALLHRGVAIYENGKIRIFKFRIYTYRTRLIDDCILEYNGRKCTVHIIVQGNDHTFQMSSCFTRRLESELIYSSKRYEKQLNSMACKKK